MLAKVFRRAAELVVQGWCQGALLDDQDRVCLVQAVWTASLEIRGRNVRPHEWTPLRMALTRRGVPIRWEFARWNDEPRRTADEVEAVLYEAAALVE